MATTTMQKPTLWVPSDWNAFFGFGTNILVNMLVLTGLLRFVLKMPDFAGVRPHPARARADDVPLHLLLRVPGLSAGAEDRPHRCLCAALGRQRAAHVRRHLRDHAADHDQDRRSAEGLVGGPGLGVLPELHPDDRRLHRAVYPQDHPRAALLGALAGISITFISMRPALEMFMTPVIGLICFAVILASWLGGYKYPKAIPAGLVAIAVGMLIAWASTAVRYRLWRYEC